MAKLEFVLGVAPLSFYCNCQHLSYQAFIIGAPLLVVIGVATLNFYCNYLYLLPSLYYMVTFVGCTVGFSFNIGNRYEAKNTLQKEKNFLFEVFLKMGLSLVSHEAELGCIS